LWKCPISNKSFEVIQALTPNFSVLNVRAINYTPWQTEPYFKMADTDTEIAPCVNFLWINGLIYFYLIKPLGLQATNVFLTIQQMLKLLAMGLTMSNWSVPKSWNATAWLTTRQKLIPNGVKCNKKT